MYAETLGSEGRWNCYDKAGALRDMLQNPLPQLLALSVMELMTAWDVEDSHHHRSEVRRSSASSTPGGAGSAVLLAKREAAGSRLGRDCGTV